MPVKSICLFIICLVLCPVERASAASQPAFWQSGQLYLLGSVHLGHPDFYPLPNALLQRLEHSQQLILEVSPNELTTPPSAGSGSARLSPELAQRLQAALAARQLSVPNQQPWVQMMSLIGFELSKLGWRPELGIDFYLSQHALQHQIPVRGLETAAEQYRILDKMAPDLLVKSGLDELGKLPVWSQSLRQAWQRGDLPALHRLVMAELADYPPADQHRLLSDRNHKWLPQLVVYAQGDRPSFVVVGAAHLLGPDGLIALLERQGYPVKRIEWPASR